MPDDDIAAYHADQCRQKSIPSVAHIVYFITSSAVWAVSGVYFNSGGISASRKVPLRDVPQAFATCSVKCTGW
jgi:hypothetical protein